MKSTVKPYHDEKLEQDEWLATEQVYSSSEIKIINMLNDLGKIVVSKKNDLTDLSYLKNKEEKEEKEDDENIDLIKCCGEQLYLDYLKPLLIERDIKINPSAKTNNILKKFKEESKIRKECLEKEKTNNLKTMKKKEQIIYLNFLRRFEEEVKNLRQLYVKEFDALCSDSRMPNVGLCSNYTEVRLVVLMFYMKYFNHTRYTNKHFENDAYEIIIGTYRCLSANKKNTKLSPSCIKDCLEHIDKTKKYCDFSNKKLFNSYPNFIVSSNYDSIFPNTSIKPYPSQVNTFTLIRDNPKICIALCAKINSGKTLSIVPIAKLIKEKRRMDSVSDKNLITTELLFCCTSKAVCIQVGRLCYNADLLFGMATIDYNKYTKETKLNIRDSHMAGKPSKMSRKKGRQPRKSVKVAKRLVTIGGPQAILEILKENNLLGKDSKKKYILFMDELNMYFDIPGKPENDLICEILAYAPEQLILSSATLPDLEKMPEIVDTLKERHSSMIFKTVNSNEVKIGCSLVSSSGSHIIPHQDCTNRKMLKESIKRIKSNPFSRQLYIANVLMNILTTTKSELSSLGDKDLLSSIPTNIDSLFKELSKISQQTIFDVSMKTLEFVKDIENEEIIKKICNKCSFNEDHSFDGKNDNIS